MASRLILLTLVACGAPETGIDDTVLFGTVRILPQFVDEGEGGAASNDVPESAATFGAGGAVELGLAPVVLRGRTASFPTDAEPAGDTDHYQFLPFSAGTWTFSVDVAGDGYDYAIGVYDVETGDPRTGDGVLAWQETSGASHVDLSVETDGAHLLGIVVWGIAGPTDAVDVPYRIRVAGAEPSSVDVLVGAYASAAWDDASLPLGGASVTDWRWDDASSIWTGTYTLYGLRTVAMRDDDDTGDDILPPPDVQDGADVVFLRGGTMADLTTAPAPGDLVAGEAVEVTVSGGRQVLADVVELDVVVPRNVAGRWTEDGDSDAVFGEVDGVWSLETEGLVAQDVGVCGGADTIDLVDGVIDFVPDLVAWDGNDVDVYAWTVPETLGVTLRVAWGDASMDIDAALFGDVYGDGSYLDLFAFGDTSCATSDDPEVCTTYADVVLEPGATYYLAVAGYAGVGAMPYHAELAWFMP
jgi:hypothetical protein